VVPAHTSGDGDIAFAISMGKLEVKAHDLLLVGTLAALAVEQAVVRSVMIAKGLKGVPAAGEWRRG